MYWQENDPYDEYKVQKNSIYLKWNYFVTLSFVTLVQISESILIKSANWIFFILSISPLNIGVC